MMLKIVLTFPILLTYKCLLTIMFPLTSSPHTMVWSTPKTLTLLFFVFMVTSLMFAKSYQLSAHNFQPPSTPNHHKNHRRTLSPPCLQKLRPPPPPRKALPRPSPSPPPPSWFYFYSPPPPSPPPFPAASTSKPHD